MRTAGYNSRMNSDTQLPGPAEEATRAGYVALLGFPNAGKSSLLNRLLEQKLSIVTPLPQTTRERVVGIDTREGMQMIFVDTPGIVRDPRYLLHTAMVHTAVHAGQDADVVLLLIDPLDGLPDPSSAPFAQLGQRPGAVVAVINKADIADERRLAAAAEWARDLGLRHLETISALTGEGIDALRARIRELLPVSPYLYPPDELSDQPVRFFVAEFVRETVLELYTNEVPYSVTVRVEEFREGSDPLYIRATIFVERASQKGILIGAGGAAIRELGRLARAKIEAFVDSRVYLDLWVKVLPKWRKDPMKLQHLGYKLPPKSHG